MRVDDYTFEASLLATFSTQLPHGRLILREYTHASYLTIFAEDGREVVFKRVYQREERYRARDIYERLCRVASVEVDA